MLPVRMKIRLAAAILLHCFSALWAADLPAVSIEHLYYLRARALRLQEFKPEEMIDYCLSQKIGGPAFDSIYAQQLWHRTELARVTKVDILPSSDPYVRWLNKSFEACTALLKEEAVHVQNGLIKEGLVALDTLDTISKAQNPQNPQNPPEK